MLDISLARVDTEISISDESELPAEEEKHGMNLIRHDLEQEIRYSIVAGIASFN